MLYIVLSVDEMIFPFFFFPRFDILVDGCNRLDRNSIHFIYYSEPVTDIEIHSTIPSS